MTHQTACGPTAAEIAARVEPWIEVDAAALRRNAAALHAKMGKPLLAVLKCNAYGLAPAVVAPCLDPLPEVWGFAVAKVQEALDIRASGAVKPILMLGDFASTDAAELVRHRVSLCTYSSESLTRFVELCKRLEQPIRIHLKVDVGVNRLGIGFRDAQEWIAELIKTAAVTVEGIFCNLVETNRVGEHLQRFKTLVANLRAKGLKVGIAHAAASYAIAHVPDCAMEMIRPGLMLYGAFPDGAPSDSLDLRCAHRLLARVIRVSALRKGEGVGYGQDLVASRPTFVATIMCGGADGYTYRPNTGCPVLINGKFYPLIARMTNYSVVDLGSVASVREGDTATLVGPEPGIRPNDLAWKSDGRTGGYDQIRYNALLPKWLSSKQPDGERIE